MSVSLKLGKLLKSLVHIRRIKNAKVLNPLVLMGIVGKEAAPADEMMWGEVLSEVHTLQRTST